MATEGTKFQVNFKTHKDGTLINIYAENIKELETQILDISMVAAMIKSTEAELMTHPTAPAQAPAPTVESIAQQFGGAQVQTYQAQAPAAPAGGANSCKHGAMSYKTGTSSKGAWQGWMCSTPKGAPDKCDTIWIR